MQLDKIEFRRMFLPSQNITCDVNESLREKNWLIDKHKNQQVKQLSFILERLNRR